MNATIFALNRYKQAITRQGTSFTFSGYDKDSNSEPDETKPWSSTLKGIFHEASSHTVITASDAGSVKSKPVPFILAGLADTILLKTGGNVSVGSSVYEITDIRDVGGFGILADISLEVIV